MDDPDGVLEGIASLFDGTPFEGEPHRVVLCKKCGETFGRHHSPKNYSPVFCPGSNTRQFEPDHEDTQICRGCGHWRSKHHPLPDDVEENGDTKYGDCWTDDCECQVKYADDSMFMPNPALKRLRPCEKCGRLFTHDSNCSVLKNR